MNLPNFSSPHCHLQSLDTGATLSEFIRRELELGTGTLTCTDHGYLGACLDVYKLAKENGLTPILGIEAYHRDDNCDILAKHGIPKDSDGTYTKSYKYGHVTIHALDQAAYFALIKKVSDADLTAEQHGSERKPIFTWRDLEELGQYNITVTAGCLIGLVGRHILADRIDVALAYYEKIRSLVKLGNFYVELFCHRCDKNWVSGAFLTLEDGTKLKYHKDKKIKTEKFSEISVIDLSKMMAKGQLPGKLLSVKNYRTWDERPAIDIVKCDFIQDFIANECTPLCPDGDIQLGSNKLLYEWAKKYGDKILISDDAHYAFPEDRIVQDTKLGGMGDSFRFYGEYHRQSTAEAQEYFKTYMQISGKEFESIVNNNVEWASRFKDFKIESKVSLPTSFYPSDTLSHLKVLIDKHGRMNWKDPKLTERLKSEIELLYNNKTIDLLPYFFLGEEICDLYDKNGVLTGPGRGSAAGLLVSYLLGITHVNPLDYNLSQDRFLTLDRILTGKMPDIDQDLPNRKLLLPHLKERFGDCYIQVSTNSLLRIKSSILDVARATWGSVPEEIAKLCASIPPTPQGVEDLDFVFGYEAEDGKEVKGLKDEHKPLQDYITKYPDQWGIVLKLAGIVRTKSRHASALIISNNPIDSFIPIMTVGGARVTQYTAASCEAAGALKMDYLNLNTLVDLSEALKLIQERSGLQLEDSYILDGIKVSKSHILPHNGQFYDIYKLPSDQNVFREICEGNTETVFQLNTVSARKWLKDFNYWKNEDEGRKSIDSIEAIAAFTALDRPGPLDAEVKSEDKVRNMLQEYAARSRGLEAYGDIEFMNKELPETMGVMVYQEQLQRVYQKLTDCTGIEANLFRDNISKKRMSKIEAAYPNFIVKASAKVGEETAKQIWDQIYTFGQYGFNKCLDGDTILNTKDGIKKLKEMIPGDIVFGIDKNNSQIETEVVKLYDNGKMETVEIEFDDGYKVICTLNHKFLTKNGMKTLQYILDNDEEILSVEGFNQKE